MKVGIAALVLLLLGPVVRETGAQGSDTVEAEAAGRCRAILEPIRGRLRDLAAHPERAAAPGAAVLTPIPRFVEGDLERTNLDFVDERTSDARWAGLAAMGEAPRAIRPPGRLWEFLSWASPAKTADDAPRNGIPPPQGCDELRHLRYVVLLKTVKYVKPIYTGENTYSPGSVTIQGLVVDLASGLVVASAEGTGRSVERVTYSKRVGGLSGAIDTIDASISRNAQTALVQAMSPATGGVVGKATDKGAIDASDTIVKAEGGNASAQHRLGLMYSNGDHLPKNVAEAARWYRKAAEQGNANAQVDLGACYISGEGVEKNGKEAVLWTRKGAEQGQPVGQLNLGWLYDTGTGVSEDPVQAAAWYRKAADQGDETAQSNLGELYMEGRGVPRDADEARRWFVKSAAQGYEEAKKNLAKLDGAVK